MNSLTKEAIEAATAAVRLYAETHPRPPHVTQKQAAMMLNISESTMSRMVKTGRIRINKFGMIPITEIDAALAAA